MTYLLSALAVVSYPQAATIIVWTPEQAQKYCYEQRQHNGHAQCVLPEGVIVKTTR